MMVNAMIESRYSGVRNLWCQADFFERGGPLNRAALVQRPGTCSELTHEGALRPKRNPSLALSRRLGAGHRQAGMTLDVTTFRDFGCREAGHLRCYENTGSPTPILPDLMKDTHAAWTRRAMDRSSRSSWTGYRRHGPLRRDRRLQGRFPPSRPARLPDA
jgi:hypothetical protein